VPKARLKCAIGCGSFQPSLRDGLREATDPALKRRAMVRRPSGTLARRRLAGGSAAPHALLENPAELRSADGRMRPSLRELYPTPNARRLTPDARIT